MGRPSGYLHKVESVKLLAERTGFMPGDCRLFLSEYWKIIEECLLARRGVKIGMAITVVPIQERRRFWNMNTRAMDMKPEGHTRLKMSVFHKFRKKLNNAD